MTSTNGSSYSSRIPGFYTQSVSERSQKLSSAINNLDSAQNYQDILHSGALNEELLDALIENAIGAFGLPLGIATNFIVNGRDVLVPMAVEETSVVAAASFGAKLARTGGGFFAKSTAPVMTGQIQFFPRAGENFAEKLKRYRDRLIEAANTAFPSMRSRGGGVLGLEWKYYEAHNMVVVYLDIDTRDAMGANIVNSICEFLSVKIEELIDCEIGIRILSNLTLKRVTRAFCEIPIEQLSHADFSGKEVARRILQAQLFAEVDIHRTATHNKGVMNGIDPVVIATGNDWRAVEAGAHAAACLSGSYKPFTKWSLTANSECLRGEIMLPLALGVVGGVTKIHPAAQLALKILGNPCAQRLADVCASVGLAQNLSALRALATEGIQKSHMELHQSNLQMHRRQGATRA